MEPSENSRAFSNPALTLDAKHKVHEGIRRIHSINVGQGLLWPDDACFGSRPNSKKRPAVRRRKSPSWNKVWHRRTEDLNKKLADDLRGRVTVEEGGFLIWTPSSLTIGQK